MLEGNRIIFTAAILFALLIAGCSGNAITSPPPGAIIETAGISASTETHHVLGSYQVDVDLNTLEVKIISKRTGGAHYDVSNMLHAPNCDDCFHVTIESFEPVLSYIEIGLTIKNPTPLTAYDVRAIMNAPGFTLHNPDGLTNLYGSGGLYGLNPFKDFATDYEKHEFAGHGSACRTFEITYPSFTELLHLDVTVDACFPGHCPDAVSIGDVNKTGDFLNARKVDISCRVKYWHEGDNRSVKLYTFGSLGYSGPIEMTPDVDDWWVAKNVYWHDGGGGPGTYPAAIQAGTKNGNAAIFHFFNITILPPETNVDWYWPITGPGSQRAYVLETDSYGNLYAGGYLDGTADFDPGLESNLLEVKGDVDAFLCKFNSSGEFLWARGFGGTGLGDKAVVSAMAINPQGDLYLTGFFNSDSFDPDPGLAQDIKPHHGQQDAFLVKMDSFGYYKWGLVWGGIGDDTGRDIALDSQGNVYITGCFEDIVDFDPGPADVKHISLEGFGTYLTSFDAAGNFKWVQTWGGESNSETDLGNGVCVSVNNIIYVTGNFGGKVDLDPGLGIDEHIAQGACDAFLSCFHTDSSFIWARSWGGLDYTEGIALDSDLTGNVYVTGRFRGLVDFDPGPGSSEADAGQRFDGFLVKYDVPGEFKWARTFGGIQDDMSNDIVVTDFDEIYIAGKFMYVCDFAGDEGNDNHLSAGGTDIFLMSYDLDGDYQWTTKYGDVNDDAGLAVAVDPFEHVFLAGYFQTKVDFFPGPGEELYYGLGGEEIFLTRLRSDGSW